MASYNPKNKRYREKTGRGDESRYTSKEKALEPIGMAVADLSMKSSNLADFMGDKFPEKELTELGEKMADTIEDEIDAIQRSKTVVEDISKRIAAKLNDTVFEKGKGGKLLALLKNSSKITTEYSSREEMEEKKKEVLADIKKETLPPWMVQKKEELEQKKASSGKVMGSVYGAMGSMLQKYEQHKLKAAGYNETAEQVSSSMDANFKEQPVTQVEQTHEEKMISLLEKIEKNTAEGGSGSGGSYDEGPKKKQGLLGKMFDEVGGASGALSAAFVGNMMSDRQSRDTMGLAGTLIAGGKALYDRHKAKKADESENKAKFEAKEDESFADRQKGVFEGEKEAAKPEKKEKSGGFLSMLMGGASKLFSGIGGMIGSLKAGLLAVLAPLAAVGTKLLAAIGPFAAVAAKFLGVGAAAAGAAYVGYKAGEAINENVLNPLASAVTGDKDDTVGTALYKGVDKVKGLFGASDEDKMKEAEKQSEIQTYEKKKAAGEQISPQLAAKLKAYGVNVAASDVGRGKIDPVKKDIGSTVEKAQKEQEKATTSKEQEKHTQVVQAGKNVTVNAPSTTVSAAPRVRHDESSLRVYINSRMALA